MGVSVKMIWSREASSCPSPGLGPAARTPKISDRLRTCGAGRGFRQPSARPSHIHNPYRGGVWGVEERASGSARNAEKEMQKTRPALRSSSKAATPSRRSVRGNLDASSEVTTSSE